MLHGRLLAVNVGPGGPFGFDRSDVLVLAHGRLMSATAHGRQVANNRVGESFYTAVSSFSLSPDGERVAFSSSGTILEGSPLPVLLVSRPDGSGVRFVGHGICQNAFCDESAPSWDRDNHSFVLSLIPNRVVAIYGGLFRVFRVRLDGSRPTLLSPRRTMLSEASPVVSPDGKKIAFLGTTKWNGPDHFNSFIYVMDADGKTRIRLPLPARRYQDLWWCGNSAALCTDINGNAFQTTIQVMLKSGRVTRRHHWLEARYAVVSHDPAFALTTRKTSRGWQLLGGPMSARTAPLFAVLLVAPHAKANPFHDFSISRG